MRTFHQAFSADIPIETVWEYFGDISRYPEFITFLKEVYIHEPIAKGSHWDDVTKVLWVPMRIPHTITIWEPKKQIVYDMKLPCNGTMQHIYLLRKDGKGSRLDCTISFDLGNFVNNLVLGALLEKRLRYMLSSSVKRITNNRYATI